MAVEHCLRKNISNDKKNITVHHISLRVNTGSLRVNNVVGNTESMTVGTGDIILNVITDADLIPNVDTAELQWLEHIWNHENMFETGVV